MIPRILLLLLLVDPISTFLPLPWKPRSSRSLCTRDLRGGTSAAVDLPNDDDSDSSDDCDKIEANATSLLSSKRKNRSPTVTIARLLLNPVFQFTKKRINVNSRSKNKRAKAISYIETRTNSTLSYLEEKDPTTKIAKKIACK